MEAPSRVTSGFFKTELESALKENGFALMAWEVHGGDDDGKGEQAHAEATVELLPEEEKQGDKGAIVEIQLTLRGYQVRNEAMSTHLGDTSIVAGQAKAPLLTMGPACTRLTCIWLTLACVYCRCRVNTRMKGTTRLWTIC